MACLLSAACVLASVACISEESSLGVCIRNCGQCKRMYGDFFLGQHCAEECLQTEGRGDLPDCNNPKSLYRFLGKT
uniref:Eclosion hormone n=1 Tax=Strigamia maritima TaxID=126957 RepID=T1JCY6_STRMM